MKIELKSLKLRNFKGARDVTISFGAITRFYGRNETGKTTLFDGWYWLLFDKDSIGRKDFGIKTTDEFGNVLHGLNHEVEGCIDIDGKILTLKKVYSEKWTKKRGSGMEEFGGHTTDYFVDDVPVKQKEYKERIDGIIKEEMLRLLTDPMYFNVQMAWQKRRELLLDVCGEVTDEEVVASNDSLADLPSILGQRSLEEYRKIIASKRSAINKELTAIPVRIDEAERSKPDTEGLSEIGLQSEIDQLKFEVESKEAEISRLQSGGEVTALQNRMREIEGELLDIKNRAQSGVLESLNEKRRSVAHLQTEMQNLESTIKRYQREIEDNQQRIEAKTLEADQCRQQWKDTNSEHLEPHVDENCPTCGQALPSDQIQSAHDKQLSNFNRQKAERLESISKRGVAAKEAAERVRATNDQLQDKIDELLNELSQVQDDHDAMYQELSQLEASIKDISQNPEYQAKMSESEDCATKISRLRQSVLEDVSKAREALMDTRDELRRKESLLARFDQVRKQDRRIEELRQEERRLATEYERFEEHLYLTETFIRSKVALMESRINSKFQYTRFRLFTEQINGGLTECCDPLYKGVAYDAGLNTGGKIIVGLDVIRTLQRHFGVYAPVWVDNDESLTSDVEMDCQLIELIASREDKQLRVEIKEMELV
ncbi:hypothetical protein [Alicyclobacillus fodiniaquatilis]|uniref:Nuclease SbcCD subunit C n=1 Tax=Alicyclobacillus fodiniaquatilis TaxID=1661150 RepID=A0ABW4JIZ5_9BACL